MDVQGGPQRTGASGPRLGCSAPRQPARSSPCFYLQHHPRGLLRSSPACTLPGEHRRAPLSGPCEEVIAAVFIRRERPRPPRPLRRVHQATTSRVGRHGRADGAQPSPPCPRRRSWNGTQSIGEHQTRRPARAVFLHLFSSPLRLGGCYTPVAPRKIPVERVQVSCSSVDDEDVRAPPRVDVIEQKKEAATLRRAR